jgi:hypothetical protein
VLIYFLFVQVSHPTWNHRCLQCQLDRSLRAEELGLCVVTNVFFQSAGFLFKRNHTFISIENCVTTFRIDLFCVTDESYLFVIRRKILSPNSMLRVWQCCIRTVQD